MPGLNNITGDTQSVSLSDINLIDTQDWTDLLSSARFGADSGEVTLQPYQTVWITNTRHPTGSESFF